MDDAHCISIFKTLIIDFLHLYMGAIKSSIEMIIENLIGIL